MWKVEAQQARTAWGKVHVRVIAEGKVVEAAEELRHASELGSGRHCQGVRRAMQSLADESCPFASNSVNNFYEFNNIYASNRSPLSFSCPFASHLLRPPG